MSANEGPLPLGSEAGRTVARDAGDSGDAHPVADATELRGLLALQEPWIRLPASLVPAFEQHRQRDLDRYLLASSFPLALLTVTIATIQNAVLAGHATSHETRLSILSGWFSVAVVCTGCVLARFRWFRRHYDAFAAVLAIVLLTKHIVLPHVFETTRASTSETYFCAIATFVVSVGLRLRLSATIAATLVPVVLATAIVPFVATRPIDWIMILYSLVAPALVGLFVALQIEQKDKLAFVQESLLVHEVRERERLHAEVERLALVDPLTGLANRREFDRRAAAEWDRQRRDGIPLSVLFVDIDHFKDFNDHHGHGEGDACIATVGRLVGAASVRPSDLSARYGGEEFVVLLPETDEDGALVVARRLLESVRDARLVHARSKVGPHVTVSIGVATTVPSDHEDVAALLARADAALYASKRGGRDRVTAATDE